MYMENLNLPMKLNLLRIRGMYVVLRSKYPQIELLHDPFRHSTSQGSKTQHEIIQLKAINK